MMFLPKKPWTEFLQRKQSLFTLALFTRPETVLLRQVTNCPTQHQINLHRNGSIFWIRQETEIKKLSAYFSGLVRHGDRRLNRWAELALHYDKITDQLLMRTFAFDPKKYKNTLSELENILLYCTVIPFWVADGMEAVKNHPKKISSALAVFNRLRLQRKYPALERTVFSVFWKTAAIRAKITNFRLMSAATPEELGKIFAGHRPVSPAVLSKRKKWAMFKPASGGTRFIFSYDRRLQNRIPQLSDGLAHTTEVLGKTAFPGHARGTVRILHEKSSIKNIRAGEIIVSPSTSPSLLPAMAKCGAIVTDEGGMGSHAAIIARELKKPCIIGTKTASRIFKTGDRIFVNATAGIAKKI